jgi:hypothetical protein
MHRNDCAAGELIVRYQEPTGQPCDRDQRRQGCAASAGLDLDGGAKRCMMVGEGFGKRKMTLRDVQATDLQCRTGCIRVTDCKVMNMSDGQAERRVSLWFWTRSAELPGLRSAASGLLNCTVGRYLGSADANPRYSVLGDQAFAGGHGVENLAAEGARAPLALQRGGTLKVPGLERQPGPGGRSRGIVLVAAALFGRHIQTVRGQGRCLRLLSQLRQLREVFRRPRLSCNQE